VKGWRWNIRPPIIIARFGKALLVIMLLVTAGFSARTLFAGTTDDKPSISHGTPAKGWLEYGKSLPYSGPNFITYSDTGTFLGRTYVHSSVKAAVLEAYSTVHHEHPDYLYVFGETGWKSGGRIRPHKTHQNGMSVDFMVPVRDKHNKPVYLPCSPFNKFGYNIEFDVEGKYDDLTIDFESMAVHLLALKKAAEDNGLVIDRVIFDPALQKLLFKTPSGSRLKESMTFSKKRSWVRHDEHYHVDFKIPEKRVPQRVNKQADISPKTPN